MLPRHMDRGTRNENHEREMESLNMDKGEFANPGRLHVYNSGWPCLSENISSKCYCNHIKKQGVDDDT